LNELDLTEECTRCNQIESSPVALSDREYLDLVYFSHRLKARILEDDESVENHCEE